MTKNIAHRGYSEKYPENSLLAFSKAIEVGCDGIELDVHLSADNVPVIMHDEKVDRTSDGSGLVRSMTLTQLKRLKLAGGERIPTLEEYFDLVKTAGIITNIELKNNVFWYEGMEEQVYHLIYKYGLQDKVILSSFNHYSILQCKKLDPKIPCGFLNASWMIDAGKYTEKYGVEYYHPRVQSLTDEVIEELHGRGILINTYTVNEPKKMEWLIERNIHGIITNDPELLGQIQEKKLMKSMGSAFNKCL